MRGLITLVSSYHVDNYLKEILAFVYYGSTVNNRPNDPWHSISCPPSYVSDQPVQMCRLISHYFMLCE